MLSYIILLYYNDVKLIIKRLLVNQIINQIIEIIYKILFHGINPALYLVTSYDIYNY